MLRRIALVSAATTLIGGAVCYHTEVLNNPWSSSFRLIRFGRATNAAFWVALDYKWSLRNLEWGEEEYDATMIQVHLRSALRLREMCSRNGGLFIKVGQHIGALEYLLPLEYVKTFQIFHSQAPKTSLQRVKDVIEEELGQPVDEVFSSLSPEPLGAASLAQVHRGTLRSNGEDVAIKVQHPYVRSNGYTDMDTVDFLVGCIHWVFPSFRFQWLAEEIRLNLPVELDFRCEAKNQERFSSLFKHLSFVKAPRVNWDLTTPRVLTMEFCEGAKVTDKGYLERHSIHPDEVSLKLGELYSEMIFQRGFVHCDPHPGNILVRSTSSGGGSDNGVEIILLDHGLYKELRDEFRINYCRLWQSLISNDQDSLRYYCNQLQAGELYRLLACMVTARSWENIQTGISHSNRSRVEMEAIQKEIPRYLPEITQLLDMVPRELVLILKTNDLLRGIEFSLNASSYRRSYITMSKSCVRALGAHNMATSSSWRQGMYLWIKMKLTLMAIHTYELWLRIQYHLS